MPVDCKESTDGVIDSLSSSSRESERILMSERFA